MQKLMNITLKAAAALLAAVLAASCVFEKEEPSQTQQKYKYVLVQLGVNTDKMTATKADGDVVNASDADGNDVETAIKDLKVYAYTLDASNNKVLRGYLSTQNVNAAATATQPLLMDIKVPFEEYGSTQQVYFMAVANAGGMTGTGDVIINSIGRAEDGSLVLPESFGFEDFASIRYSVADQTFANGMPMYCQTSTAVTVNLAADGTANTAPGHNGHTQLPVKVTLDLTRSLSKIEVYAAESAGETTGKDGTATTSVTITGVSLANVPESGNLFTAPAANATLTYTDFNGEGVTGTGYSPSFLNDEDETVSVNKKVRETVTTDIQNPDNYTLVSDAYYLAENNQGSAATYEYGPDAYPVVGEKILTDAGEQEVASAATVLKIDYTVGGTSKTGYVKMPQIKRNTWYKVLARIQANGEIALVFVVKPWNVDKTELTYSDVISITTPAAWSFEDNNNASFDDQKGEVSLRTSTDSYFTFKIDQPAGAEWTATLIPISGQLDSFKFIIEDGSEVSTVTGDVGTSKTLTIHPTGSPDAENNVASLRITIKTKEGNTKFVTPSELLKNTVSYKEFTIIHSN